MFGSLLLWRIQILTNTMPRRKYVTNDLRDAIVAAYQCGKLISKQFEVYHFTVRKIIPKGKTFKTFASLPQKSKSQ